MDHLLHIDIDVVSYLTKLNAYDYIIVGSGFGGGPLAEVLAQRKKKVLLIERGGVIFSTHVLNTSRPYFNRGASNSPEGNESVYDAVKAKVQTTEGSESYIGGPVYCVGGRSNLWGIWTPQVSEGTLNKYYPPEIASFLREGEGYRTAFNFLTDSSQQDAIYPLESGQITANEIDEVKAKLHAAVGVTFDLMPVAAQFNAPAPYQFPQGAYSTTLNLMNRMYANDRYLTVLLNTEVVALDQTESSTFRRSVNALKVRDVKDREIKKLDVGNAKVILSAGTIGTASIALTSGLQHLNPLVGRGIMDHDIYYVRFGIEQLPDITRKPLNLKSVIEIEGETVLLTVTVNANFFLAGSSASLPTTQYYLRNGELLSPKKGFENQENFDTVCVLFEFVGRLDDRNEVVNLPGMDPVLSIQRPPVKQVVMSGMEDIIRKVRNIFVFEDVNHVAQYGPPLPQHMGFGVFSHEAGTMRMDNPNGDGVVDTDLRVKGFDNLWACDMSVFPVSPEANPALTLAALSLRLADHLSPPEPEIQPLVQQDIPILKTINGKNGTGEKIGNDAQ
uniref:4-amino-4-deoxyarabinitol oxidase n=1 Tax=Thelonectria discophora TaxID=1053259 RepID=A0A0S3Q283_9HYPO|nr:4-amino-4-deoxyarabinitol oxidase [Thelonectria discophora]